MHLRLRMPDMLARILLFLAYKPSFVAAPTLLPQRARVAYRMAKSGALVTTNIHPLP